MARLLWSRENKALMASDASMNSLQKMITKEGNPNKLANGKNSKQEELSGGLGWLPSKLPLTKSLVVEWGKKEYVNACKWGEQLGEGDT